MRSWLVVPTLLTVALPLLAGSSGPKSQDKKNPPAKKVYTDEDLARYRPPAPPSPSPAAASPSATSSRTPAPVQAAPTGVVGSSETHATDRQPTIDEYRSAVTAAQTKVEQVKSQIAALNAEAERVLPDSERLEKIQVELGLLAVDLEQATRELEAAQGALAEKERPAGPPGDRP